MMMISQFNFLMNVREEIMRFARLVIQIGAVFISKLEMKMKAIFVSLSQIKYKFLKRTILPIIQKFFWILAIFRTILLKLTAH